MRIENPKIENYLKRIHLGPCSLCNGNAWNVSDVCGYIPEYKPNLQDSDGSRAFPLIAISCKNCGNTYFILNYSSNNS